MNKRGVETVGELRKDYILDRWVVISTGRGSRPHEFKEQPVQSESKACFFCPGNESMTPAEIGRVGNDCRWQIRWFENKFPAIDSHCTAKIKTDNQFYTFSLNCGRHEIVVETPEHSKQLADLSVAEISALFGVFSKRILALSADANVVYVNVFKNHGPAGGTSLVHSHSQIMATQFVPGIVFDEVFASRKFVGCPYCKIVASEKNSARRCFENDSWVAFAPYASRFNYEVWLFPKSHIRTLAEVGPFDALADILKKALLKLNELHCSYNFCVHYAPSGFDLHLHIEVTPRIAVFGGFELGTGAVINSVSPEDAAAFYRGEKNV